MSATFTLMGEADKDLAKAKAEHAAAKRQAGIEFHGLDLKSKRHALAEAAAAEAARESCAALLPAARAEEQRLRKLINIDFTHERNDRVKEWRKAKAEADELECLSRPVFGHYAMRAIVCHYRADQLP